MTYTNPTKSIFRIDLDMRKIDSYKDIERILHALADDIHSGEHDVCDVDGNVVGKYGVIRMLR